MKRKTKIICTIGPKSESKEMLAKLAVAGMNIARLNFSHGNHQEQGSRIEKIKEINKNREFPVAILLDTKGPEIRTHLFKGGVANIEKDSTVNVHMNEILGDNTKFSLSYGELINDVEIGDTILVDDGYLRLKVTKIEIAKKVIVTTAVNTHEIKDRRGINVPEVSLKLPFLSEKDKNDMEFACDQDLDFIAASFVRTREDVLEIRKILKRKNNDHIQIIAKIENQQGVNNLDEILDAADGVMVARGDLGVEVDFTKLPLIQRKMIEKAHINGKIVITATQMLESMIKNITPTRAEVSDVANAVFDGTDAIMLSGETAAGEYPVIVVETMSKIAESAEQSVDRSQMLERFKKSETENRRTSKAITLSVTNCINELPVVGLVCLSKTGYTARIMSQSRPAVPIIALVDNIKVARKLALNYGVFPVVPEKDICCMSDAIQIGMNQIMNHKDDFDKSGDRIVVTAGLPLGQTTLQTNAIEIVRFLDYPKWAKMWK